jgi:hypothetical protein
MEIIKNTLCGLMMVLLIGLAVGGLYLAFGLVPTVVEHAVDVDMSGFGEYNRFFYFMYFATVGFGMAVFGLFGWLATAFAVLVWED